MRFRRIAIALAVLVVMAAGIGYRAIGSQAGVEVKTATVRRGNIETTISAPGKIVLPGEVKLSFKTGGRLERLLVKEGDSVRRGQILAQLDISDLVPQLKQAEANLSTAKANWSKLKVGTSAEELDLAQVAADNAEIALEATQRKLTEVEASTAQDLAAAQTAVDNAKSTRDWNLAQREEALKDWQDKVSKYEHPVYHLPNYTPSQQVEVDAAKAKADSTYTAFLAAEEAYKAATESNRIAQLKAESALRSAQDQVDAANGQYRTASAQLNIKKAPLRPQDAKVARNQIKLAQAALDQIQNKMDDATLRTPMSGTVISISTKEGEFVSGGSGLSQFGGSSAFLVLSESSRVQVIAELDESDIAGIRIGRPAKITLDAYPGRLFEGKVTEIAISSSQSSEGGTVFPVKIDPVSAEVPLLKGMAGDVKITRASRKNVIVVPASAIVKSDEKNIVFAVKGSIARSRQVKLGLSSEDYYEVKDGLREGERIVIEGASKLTNGMRVRAR